MFAGGFGSASSPAVAASSARGGAAGSTAACGFRCPSVGAVHACPAFCSVCAALTLYAVLAETRSGAGASGGSAAFSEDASAGGCRTSRTCALEGLAASSRLGHGVPDRRRAVAGRVAADSTSRAAALRASVDVGAFRASPDEAPTGTRAVATSSPRQGAPARTSSNVARGATRRRDAARWLIASARCDGDERPCLRFEISSLLHAFSLSSCFCAT